jgi:hypothetical protein
MQIVLLLFILVNNNDTDRAVVHLQEVTYQKIHYFECAQYKGVFLNGIKQTFPISKKWSSWQQTVIRVVIEAMK